MLARNKALLSFFIIVLLVGGMYMFTDWFSKVTGYALGEDEKVKLSQCLTAEKAVLYVSSSCFACDSQIDLFGKTATPFLTIEICDDVKSCEDLKGVPAWKIKDEFFYGEKTLEELINLSGCIFDEPEN